MATETVDAKSRPRLCWGRGGGILVVIDNTRTTKKEKWEPLIDGGLGGGAAISAGLFFSPTSTDGLKWQNERKK